MASVRYEQFRVEDSSPGIRVWKSGVYGVCAGKSGQEAFAALGGGDGAYEVLAGVGGTVYTLQSLSGTVYSGNTVPASAVTLSFMDGNVVAATGVLTFAGIAVADTTITIGTRVYTWKAAAVAVDEIAIGANQAASEANLTDAINNGPTGGGGANADVTAVDGAGTVTLTAIALGAAGNAIATTETMASASFGAVTLTGGNDGTVIGSVVFDVVQSTSLVNWDYHIEFDPIVSLISGNGLFAIIDVSLGGGGQYSVHGRVWKTT